MDFTFHARHIVADNECYYVVFDELRRERAEGFDQLLVAHIDFKKFNKQALARLLPEWELLRAIIQCPLFAYCADGDAEPDKWERFVRLLGFEEVPHAVLPASDGSARRIFVSHMVSNAANTDKEYLQHYVAVGRSSAVSDAGVSERAEHL